MYDHKFSPLYMVTLHVREYIVHGIVCMTGTRYMYMQLFYHSSSKTQHLRYVVQTLSKYEIQYQIFKKMGMECVCESAA